MEKLQLLFGLIIGFLACALGSYVFIILFTQYDFITGFQSLQREGQAGKLIALGALLNVVCFFVLLKFKKEMMARGVVLSTILLTIYTIFI